MTYDVKFRLFIDGDEELTQQEIAEFIKDCIDSGAVSAYDVESTVVQDEN